MGLSVESLYTTCFHAGLLGLLTHTLSCIFPVNALSTKMKSFSQLSLLVVASMIAAMTVRAQEPTEHECDTKDGCDSGKLCCHQNEP